VTITEHNRRCRCTPANPCSVLAAILREQHGGGLFEVTDPGRLPRKSPRDAMSR
jgi:hypothetical protein